MGRKSWQFLTEGETQRSFSSGSLVGVRIRARIGSSVLSRARSRSGLGTGVRAAWHRSVARPASWPPCWRPRTPGPGRDRALSAFSIRLWQAEIAQEVSYSIRSEGGLVAWRVSPDGRAIATVTADGVVTIRDLFWHEPIASAVAAPAAGALKTDRGWFAPMAPAPSARTLEGIRLIGGMPTSEGTPKLVMQHWRLPGLTPLWKQPVELPGEPMQLASAKVAFSPGAERIAIGTTDVRLFNSGSGERWERHLWCRVACSA